MTHRCHSCICIFKAFYLPLHTSVIIHFFCVFPVLNKPARIRLGPQMFLKNKSVKCQILFLCLMETSGYFTRGRQRPVFFLYPLEEFYFHMQHLQGTILSCLWECNSGVASPSTLCHQTSLGNQSLLVTQSLPRPSLL